MFSSLEHPDKFRNRHIGPNASETQALLTSIQADTLEQLIDETIPAHIRLQTPLPLPGVKTEYETLAFLRGLAAKNIQTHSYIGMGYYDCIIPGVIQRNILENPGWYTQYTPYQAEISQGRMEALLNFQTMVCSLTGMEIANASLLDEGTAAAEAMTMLYAQSRSKTKSEVFLVSQDVHPQTIAILLTRAEPLGIELAYFAEGDTKLPAGDYFGVLIQYPTSDGNVYDYRNLIKTAHQRNIAVVCATDLLSLCLLTPPGEMGADVVVGSSQRFGVPLGYGGPHAAFFATKDEYKRNIPGRIIGVSIDADGNNALRLALQTREQHIRREKATSNICTAQVLLAVMAGMYAVYHGPTGLKAIAKKVHAAAQALEATLVELGFKQLNQYYFDTLRVHIGDNAGLRSKTLRKIAEDANINFRYYEDGTIGIALNETVDIQDLQNIVNVFRNLSPSNTKDPIYVEKHTQKPNAPTLPVALYRTTEILTHPVFNRYHSETELLRYIKKLENRDLSLTSSMIPLGSCTMKLNATAEMVPLSYPGFSNIHPFAPVEQTKGYQTVFSELSKALCAITGFDAFSLQPNSGAQGEYAGLMVIRKYHNDNGQGHRNIALIPSSAHGTNPASAVMAGMKVVVVKCDVMGNIDVADLKAKAEQHSANLAALMVTYPSTHGVFEEAIQEICNIIHQHGGLVYMDGANMNAQVGLTNPATIGADVCHLNLHKTFCIPHGGGGPGMGPIGVVAKLAPYLPGHPLINTGGNASMPPVSAAPWGSASILLISYAYILMMGGDGLTDATRYAILNANYIKTRLEKYYPVLYQGKNKRVAHELILDMREFKHSADIEVEDIAKRLMDYGFHAPTISFPVPGTMMIEPTESENKAELDRFCTAMIAIRAEIQAIIDGKADKADNVLKNAPHTATAITADHWTHPYSRQIAAFPAEWVKENKFWPYVGRVNNVYGDRNLICTCPPIESYSDEPFGATVVESTVTTS